MLEIVIISGKEDSLPSGVGITSGIVLQPVGGLGQLGHVLY